MTSNRHLIHLPNDLSDRLADLVVTFMGSWRFIITQSVIVVFWIALNVLGFVSRWDAYPFILLNLLFSTQAAYASPLVLMSQNRSAAKDKARDTLEAEEVDGIYSLMKELDGINRRQLEILEYLHTVRLASSDPVQGKSNEAKRQ